MMVEITTVSWADAAGDDAGRSQRDQPPHLGRETRALPRHADAELCAAAKATTTTCSTPEAAMPQASATPAWPRSTLPEAIRASSTAISTMLSRRGRERGDGEAAERVQDAGIERDQRHADEIGQRDARQQHRERELLGVVGEARREQQHQPWHGDLAEHGERDEQESQAGQRLPGKRRAPLRARRRAGAWQRAG